MKEGDEIAAISQRLTELKLREKMVTWVFHNHKNWSEEKINAVLDEKTRIGKAIKALENRLKELES